MSNMYGYSDYNGPSGLSEVRSPPEPTASDDDDDVNPLQVGFWMEGDSLAPPCGTSIPTIHRILGTARVTSDDVLYDLGCGDGRICLEAFATYQCQTVGVEVEDELVQRGNFLISQVIERDAYAKQRRPPRLFQADLRDVLQKLVQRTVADASSTSQRPLQAVEEDLPLPTIIILYLLPDAIEKITPELLVLLEKLERLRIVCNTWGITKLLPEGTAQIKEDSGAITTLFVYTKSCLRA